MSRSGALGAGGIGGVRSVLPLPLRAAAVAERGTDRSLSATRTASASSGESSSSPVAVAHLLCIHARLVAMVDASQHDARLPDRRAVQSKRLLPGELVVGVVAHQGMVGDGSRKRELDAIEAIVQMLGHISHVLLQRFKRLLQRRRCGRSRPACAPSPSTSFCAARKLRTRLINTMHTISASTATASAASATMPCVLSTMWRSPQTS